jgi:hypothetical protein
MFWWRRLPQGDYDVCFFIFSPRFDDVLTAHSLPDCVEPVLGALVLLCNMYVCVCGGGGYLTAVRRS